VDRHGTPAAAGAVPVGQPGTNRAGHSVRVQAGQGPADGGLGRDTVVVGAIAAGRRARPGRCGEHQRPFGDRGHRAGTGKRRGGGQGQDGDERVAAATGSSRVRDTGQVGEQVWCLGWLERVGIAQWVKTRRDRG
jgi:hypothetical protein